METLAFVMAIMGCADGGAACTEARVAPVAYPSIEACHAAMPVVLERSTDLSYPIIQAACRRTVPVMADARTTQRPG